MELTVVYNHKITVIKHLQLFFLVKMPKSINHLTLLDVFVILQVMVPKFNGTCWCRCCKLQLICETTGHCVIEFIE